MSSLRSYRLLSTFELDAIRAQLVFLLPIQFLLSAALAVGLGFLIPDIDAESARYLSTGAPTIALLTIGMVVLPSIISQQKVTGQDEFYRTLPIPAPITLAAQLTPSILTSLPGALLSLVVASRYFDFTLDPSPMAIVALVFVAMTGCAIGTAVAAVSPHPQVTMLLTNILVFFVMLFSPINFPVERLPDWLERLHAVLPIESMAELVRSTLTGVPTHAGDWLLVGTWAIGSFLLSAALMARRD